MAQTGRKYANRTKKTLRFRIVIPQIPLTPQDRLRTPENCPACGKRADE